MPDNTQQQSSGGISGELRKIGNYLGLRQEIDPNHRITNMIRANLSTVDIIPVDFAIRLNYIANRQSNSSKDYAIAYDFDVPTANYRKRCQTYKLDGADGVQLWLTDDTQAYEEITNTFDNNIIETGINQVSGWAQTVQGYLKSLNLDSNVGTQSIPGGAASIAAKALTVPITGSMSALGIQHDAEVVNRQVANVTQTVADIVLQGKQISLPKIWKQSDYNPSITFNVKLVSPYGDPECVKRFITEPLVYLLLLFSPQSDDGLSYGLYQPVKIKAYGISNINLGAITSVSLRRGGRESAYNVYKQPIQVDVGINIMSLTSGFAFLSDGLTDVATMDDAAVEYSENANGSPAITTVGNIIQSLRPAPQDIVNQNTANLITSTFTAEARSNTVNWFNTPGTRTNATPSNEGMRSALQET